VKGDGDPPGHRTGGPGEGGYLGVESGSAPFTLANDVRLFAVQTFDESSNALPGTMSGAACRDIRQIELTLTLSRHGVSETLRTRIFVRAAISDGGSGP